MGVGMIREDGVEVSAMVRFSTMLKRVHITVQHLAVDSHPKATYSRMEIGIGRAAVAWERPDKHCTCSKCMRKAHIKADAFQCNWRLEGVEASRSG